jgi:uncharacterized membrane protein (UPF0127 family)
VNRAAVAALLLFFVLPSACKSEGDADQAAMVVAPITIKTAAGKTIALHVEMALTPEQQSRGLMFREALDDDKGMLFPYNSPQVVSFWMKNTVIPLDMIFIRKEGTIARIAAETEPYSLEKISSGEPVTAVLEIAGGRAAALGIGEDDVVTLP